MNEHQKISEDDEGPAKVMVIAVPSSNVVVVQFSKPIVWFGLRSEELDMFIAALQEQSKVLRQ